MASRHDIVNITFQANAGKANVALQTLQAEAKKSSDQVDKLKKQLEDGLKANLPADQIQKIRDDIKKAKKDTEQWDKAYRELTKGVRTLDEAVKQFNAGTMNKMSAAFNKAAANAAKLAQTKMTPGTQEWKEMDALIVEAQSNVLKANTAINELVMTIHNGGKTTKSTLAQAKTDLEQLLTLEVRGSAEWNIYNKQLKMVNGELAKLADAEKKAAQADQTTAMNKRMKGLKTMSSETLAETKRFWESMVAGAENGSAELSKYEDKLKRVINEEKRRKRAGVEQVLATPSKFGVEQVRQAVQQMTQLRDSLQQGTPMWQHYNKMVKEGEKYLTEYANAEKIARGEALSLADALKLSATAGGKGFSGTANQLKMAEEALQKAAAAAKKGSPEWQKYQEALAKVRVEMQSAGMTSERMQTILNKPSNAKNLNELSAAVKRAKMELDLMAETVGKDSKAYTQLADATKKAEIQLKALQSQSRGTATAFDKAWSRLKTYIGLYMGAAVAIQKLTAAFGDVMELSDKMGEVRKTTGFTAEEVGRLSESLRKLDVRTPLVNLMEVAAAAGQLGLKTEEDVQGFTEAANKLMIALPEMGKEAATEMMRVAIATGEVEKIRKQLQEGTIEGSSATAVAMEKIASTIDRLRATSASTAPEITDFVKRVGAVGAQSGITIDQVSALGSTISSLGMRVEMSATALSRMIPAIKNNSFAIAKAIGTTQSWIDAQFKAGKGMNVILEIFDHIRQANMDAESIEQMFGASMQDVMKELNQQGARAGIVFAGLSQGVDELRRQLDVAADAYEKNIAVQQEFEKMNETTAAKWERLKNQLEESFVGDQAQRALGWIIDGLRTIIDLLTGDSGLSVALRTVLTYWAAIKVGFGQAFTIAIPKMIASMTAAAGSFFTTAITGMKALTWQLGVHNMALGRARVEWKKMDLAMKSNYIGAIIAAVGYLAYKLYDLHRAAKEAAAEIGKFNQKLYEENKALNDLFVPLNNSNIAQEERLKLISEINSKYSKYLGYMLSETSSAIQLADAHALIAKRIREEAYERRIAEKEKDIREGHSKDVNAAYAALESAVRGGVRGGANVQEVTDILKGVIDNRLGEISFAGYREYEGKDGLTRVAEKIEETLGLIEKAGKDYIAIDQRTEALINSAIERQVLDGRLSRENVEKVREALRRYTAEAKTQHDDIMNQTSNMRSDLRGIQGAIQTDLTNNLTSLINNVTNAVANASKPQAPSILLQPQGGGGISAYNWSGGGTGFRLPWQSQKREEALIPLPSQTPKANKKNVEEVKAFVQAQDQLRSYLQANAEHISEQQRATAEAYLVADSEMAEYRKIIADSDRRASGGTGGGGSPYGGYKPMDPYEQWDADSLVARRKQMLEFVRALAGGADVQAVLAKDEKFMDEATRKGIKNMRDAIAWYNEERLKIQEELHTRNLTNTGDWMDPKKTSGRKKKPKTPESEAAIAELDRYYSERKELIEEARSKEEMSDAEYNRRIDALEMEHLQKRSDLRKTFTSEDQGFIRQFRQWWASVAELDEVSWETIEAEWKAAWERDRKYNNREAQKDLTAMQAITVKQLKAIEAIIDKERPFNGITRNLQDNLTTMGIMFADGVEGTLKESVSRTTFLLKEAENAYELTWEQLEKDMRENGLGAWADAIAGSENAEKAKRAILNALHTVYDDVQDAIKKEAAQVKKQVDITWNDTILSNGKSIKQTYEETIAALGVAQGRVSRANSLIGAGQASERVADRLAIKQMQVQLRMQEHYYNLVRKTGLQRIDDLKKQAEGQRQLGELAKAERLELDAKHATMSLNLSLTKEQTELNKQREDIIARTEESQARLYKELREWGDLIASSVQSVMEASNAGNAEYYNELAKIRLTGQGGPGAGTYIVIDDQGTENARAHYEYLDTMQALERQREIEQQNAVAEAFEKAMDDLNQKLSDIITDQLNAMLQNQSIDLNTDATLQNTDAIAGLTNAINGQTGTGLGTSLIESMGQEGKPAGSGTQGASPQPGLTSEQVQEWKDALGDNPMLFWEQQGNIATQSMLGNMESIKKGQKGVADSAQSTFAKMTMAANMYGIAYQAMSNDNLNATQKFEMIALQAIGNYAINSLTAFMAKTAAEGVANEASVLGKLWSQLGVAAAPVFAIFTGLLGAAMAAATNTVAKSKSQIASVTGSGVSQGRLATGMLTYAEGNVNEFTDPASLTPGRSYNVDAADGRTYRAKFTGSDPGTHLTSGPEFHLVGERGREAIIDAHTTRLLQMNDVGIWKAIQTLSSGGSLRSVARRRSRGVPAFADGNMEEFTGDSLQPAGDGGFGADQMAAFQASLDRNSAIMERLAEEGIEAFVSPYGKRGIVNGYDQYKKEAERHGEKYL